MWFSSVVAWWRSGASRTRRPQSRPARRHGPRLTVEQLEDRMVPSSFSAGNVTELIHDINLANAAGGPNTITLRAGKTFSLSAVNNTTDGATGLPVIAANGNLTIVGNGDVIERASGTAAFRLFDVASGASLILQHLTLQGGFAFGAGVSADGGAVYNQGALDLNAVTVQNNAARGQNGANASFGHTGGAGQSAAGGGIYSSGSSSSLTLEGGTQVQNNQAIGGAGGSGTTVTQCYSAANICKTYVFAAGQGGAAFGAGLYVGGGTVTGTSATVSSNLAQGGQGGYGNGTNGAAGGSGFGGGMYVAGGTVTLTSASMFSNTTQGGNGGQGVSGGAGGNGFGGALYMAGGTVTLRNDTVTSNSAQGGAGGSGSPAGSPGVGEGGGLYIASAASVCLDAFTLANIINNTASTSYPNIFGSYTVCP